MHYTCQVQQHDPSFTCHMMTSELNHMIWSSSRKKLVIGPWFKTKTIVVICVSKMFCFCAVSVKIQRIELTRSSTSVASGVLLVLGGITLSLGRECSDWDGMFLMKVKLEKKMEVLKTKNHTRRVVCKNTQNRELVISIDTGNIETRTLTSLF